MGYGDAKVVVQVTEREDKALEHAGPNGTTTYYPKGGLIRLEALELQVCQQLEEPGDGETHPTLKTRVYGEARLKDCDLSIIGEPENKTRNLKITIQAGELSPAALEADRLEVASEPGRFVSQPMGAAQLGFIRSDRESVRPDQWWLMCSVPVACLQVLRPALISIHRPTLSEVEQGGVSHGNFGGTRTQGNAGRQGARRVSRTPRTTPPAVCAGGVYGR